MPIVKQSFISNLIGRQNYEDWLEYAKPIVIIGSVILILLFVLSSYFHWTILSYLVNLTYGLSLLFIGFILNVILLLDVRIEVEEPERNYWGKTEKLPKPLKYKFTIVWALALASMGIIAIYLSNKYSKQYTFECNTFYVDREKGIYHLEIFIEDCDKAIHADYLEEMKGYQINKSVTLCEDCEEMLEDYGP